MNINHPNPVIEFGKRTLAYFAVIAFVVAVGAILISILFFPSLIGAHQMVERGYFSMADIFFLATTNLLWLGVLTVIAKAFLDTMEAHEND